MSRIISSRDNKFFATVSSYQVSSKLDWTNNDFETYAIEYVSKLNKVCYCSDWKSLIEYNQNYRSCNFAFGGKEKAVFLINNDMNITKESFFNQLYAKLFNECDYILNTELNEDKKNFIRGFCELRGSIDTNRPLLAIDYFYDSIFELGKARILYEYLSVPFEKININFRDLQAQFVSNINKRNTQLRLELSWYVNNIGLLNDYKTAIVSKVYFNNGVTKIGNFNYIKIPIHETRGSTLFIDRLAHFSTKIFGKNLNRDDIAKLRNELGFDVEVVSSDRIPRNREIVEIVRLFSPDICAGCHDEYNTQDRTFIHRRTGRHYFEIHHNISFSNNFELDHEDNLVKLCPICHTCIKSGVGTTEGQKKILKNILSLHPNVKDFASHFFNTDKEDQLVERIYGSLK